MKKCIFNIALLLVFFFSLFVKADDLEVQLNKLSEKFDSKLFFTAINEIKKSGGSSRADKQVEQLFLKNDYNLDKNQISYIKIKCANYLLQRKKNNLYRNEKLVLLINQNLSAWLNSDDIDVKLDAIDLLGLIDTSENFTKLVSIIKKQDPLTFRRASYAIQLLCESYNENEYLIMSRDLPKKNQQILNEYKTGLRKFSMSHGWCD